MIDLINKFCETNNHQYLLGLDYSVKQFMVDGAKYCIENKKGNIRRANIIINTIGGKDTGLIINKKTVKSISGPAYLTILKPKMDYFQKIYSEEKTFAPVFMIFGDIHRSNEEMCTDCNCNIHDSGCCYKVYEDKFLKLLDKIPKLPKFNVDFSMENDIDEITGDLYYVKYLGEQYQEGKENAYVLRLLRERILGCYSKKLKINQPKEYKKYCPTQNIRWHSVDTRFTEYIGKSTWEYFLGSELPKLLHFFTPRTDKNKDTWSNELKENLDSMLYKADGTADITKLNYLRDSLDLFTDNDNYYKKFIANKENSLICKQISKMKNVSIQNQWYDWIKKYFSYKKNSTGVKVDKIIIESWNNFINFLISYSEISGPDKESRTQAQIKYINSIYEKNVDFFTDEKLNEFNFMPFYTEDKKGITYYDINSLISMNTTLLDLYYLTRMFKKPTNDYNPLLSIGYFGMKHSQDINYFLLNITGLYEDVYTESNIVDDKQFRCLQIKEHINLDEILKTYKQAIKK